MWFLSTTSFITFHIVILAYEYPIPYFIVMRRLVNIKASLSQTSGCDTILCVNISDSVEMVRVSILTEIRFTAEILR